MKESFFSHSNLARRLAFTAIGGGIIVGGFGAIETQVHDASEGLKLVGLASLPLALGTTVLAINKSEKKLYKKRRENFINGTFQFHTGMNVEDNPNIIEGEFRIIEPTKPSETQSLVQE